jgi:hypothetical protein
LGSPKGAPQIPPLRYAPVGMTILSGNAKYSFQDELATMEELQGIYDRSAEAPGENPRSYEHEPIFFHVKGNLFLTGMQWGSTSKNDGGNPSVYVWVFDFKDGGLVL